MEEWRKELYMRKQCMKKRETEIPQGGIKRSLRKGGQEQGIGASFKSYHSITY
jgi:hypothetical protein